VWSGNAPNRAQATAVKIVAGQTKTLDVSAPATAAISGQVTGPAGVCIRCTSIYAVDATTGDYAGIMPNVFADGTFTIKGLNTQDVWLFYSAVDSLVRYPTQFHTTAGTTQSGVIITRP
jgi:hypothetical protein